MAPDDPPPTKPPEPDSLAKIAAELQLNVRDSFGLLRRMAALDPAKRGDYAVLAALFCVAEARLLDIVRPHVAMHTRADMAPSENALTRAEPLFTEDEWSSIDQVAQIFALEVCSRARATNRLTTVDGRLH